MLFIFATGPSCGETNTSVYLGDFENFQMVTTIITSSSQWPTILGVTGDVVVSGEATPSAYRILDGSLLLRVSNSSRYYAEVCYE
jgi:hypothetical protein